MWIFWIILVASFFYGVASLFAVFKVINSNLHILDKSLLTLFLLCFAFSCFFLAFKPKRILWALIKAANPEIDADALLNSKNSSITRTNKFRLLHLSEFLYSKKTKKEVFEPIFVDWQEEYFEALSKKQIWKSRWINVRYTYAFLGAMWQKSPLGDLIEFISKIAK
jgi:hypothetical protein